MDPAHPRRPWSRRPTLVVAAAVATLATAVATVVTAAPVHAQTACDVDYTLNDWSAGFVATVVITNSGAPVSSWSLTWSFAGNQRITSSWEATVTQTGSAVTARNAAHNGGIPTGGTARFGFQASYSGANAVPTDFALNGVPCGEEQPPSSPPGSPTGSPTVSPSDGPTNGPGICSTTMLLCDNFENQSGTTPGGGWTVTHPDCQGAGSAVVDTSQARSGSRSIRINGAAGYCNHVFVQSTADLGRLGAVWYGRFYVRHTTMLPASHVTFVAMTDAADGGRELRIGGQNAALQWNRESDDATLPEQSPTGVSLSRPLPTGTWSCVEYMVDGGAGHIRTWLNGELVSGLVVDGQPTPDVDSQWLRRANWRPSLTDFRFGWESYGEGADTLWFDDVALGNERVGC